MPDSMDNAKPARHKGRPPGCNAFTHEEFETLRIYLHRGLPSLAKLIYQLIIEPSEILRGRQYARNQILKILKKPGGVADHVYILEVNRLSKYRGRFPRIVEKI